MCQFDSNLSQVKSKQFSGKGIQFSTDEDVSVAMGQVRDELGNVMGEQTIRHGRSRNHFSRMIREKKQGEINMAVHHKDRILVGEDVVDHDAKLKLLSLIAPGQTLVSKINSSGLSVPTQSRQIDKDPAVKEDKYDLRSYFGFTVDPLGPDVTPDDQKGDESERTSPSTTMKTTIESLHVVTYSPAKVFGDSSNRTKKKEDLRFDDSEINTDTPEEDIENTAYPDEGAIDVIEDSGVKVQGHADIVTRFLRIVESQHLLGENCTAGTDLNLGEGVVDRYAQERFRVEADVAVNRANMLTRLWKYAGPEIMFSEYLQHANVFSMVEFDDDIFAAGNCYDQYQYKDYQLFCPFAYRLPEGPILVKDLAVEYKYLSNTSEWFYIARKNAENVIHNYNQFSKGFNTYTYNESAHTDRVADEILSVTYEDGKWSKPYYDCGGGNIWMLTYTVPFFGFANDTYFFKGTSGIDIDLRRVDIDQCPLQPGSTQLNIFAATDKCKKRTTDCESLPGLGFRRGSYKCVCRRGFYFPDTSAEYRFYNGTVIEEEYEKLMMGEVNRYATSGIFECLPCAEGCEACKDSSPCVVSLNWLMRSAILALTCVVICCLPIVVFFTWKYGNVKVVRAASPVLLRVIALGALLIYCTNIVMYPRPTVYTCTARVWLREIGFCLTYGALMLKTWRISVIFRVRSAKAVKITDFNLLKRLGIIVAVFSVFLIIRTLVAPPVVIVGRTATDLKAYLCKTDWWDHSFTSLEVIFLIWGIRLCIVVRKAPSEFNESRFISMAIYNEFLLSLFLNISMLFLQSPANPDLLYIIFFCHTQLTITLLLCFIFGSKAYLVFKGHGKNEHEGSSMVPKTPTGKFISKSRSGGNSQYATSTNSSAGLNEYTKVTELDIQEEFRRLYTQLEHIKEKNMRFGNRHLTAKISAMQEAAVRQDSLKEDVELSGKRGKGAEGSRFNMFSACTAITPAEESSSSGREYVLEASDSITLPTKSKRLNVTFSPMKSCECDSNSSSKNVDNTSSQQTNGGEELTNGKFKPEIASPQKTLVKAVIERQTSSNCDKCLNKESSIDDESEPPMSVLVAKIELSEQNDAAKPSTDTSPQSASNKSGKAPIKSGHARTHAIVINLDDKSRFTEEVTV
ncbi:metabotropic glycine receptor [Arctopsyche grandis]|uniref:metabotropic glycine receptor n=1 Tax=Arctopsyche grandis TaxID=121162 RepID=UPI00406D89FA